MANKFEPYVGPRPFDPEDKSRFFGREHEANELLSLIIAHPVVILYAPSGAGKTSLLNAKVIPLLEEKNSQVFGSARIGGELPQGVADEDVENIFVFNSLMSLQGKLQNSQSLVKMSFMEFMKAQSRDMGDDPRSRRAVIFDQFEEIFSTHPERWKDREGFFNSIGDSLEHDPGLRVIFSIREEYIAHMEPFAPTLPERLRTRFRLERLREEAALLAVTGPLEGTGYSFAPGAAEKLVRGLLQVPIKSATGTVDVLGEFVEPVQLQVVCKNMWRSLPPSIRVIDERYIKNYGDVDKALVSYFDECIEKAVGQGDIREGVLRRWFGQKLITPDRTRGTVYRDTYTTGGLKNEVVAILEHLHLVRPELRGGAPWYELTHDRFIGPIIKSNEDWLNKKEEGKLVSQRLEKRTEDWTNAPEDRRAEYLLPEGELLEATEWLKSPDAEELGVSDSLSKFVQTSEIVIERKHAETQVLIAKKLRQQRNILAIAIGVALTAIVCAIILNSLKNRAETWVISSSSANGRMAKYLSNKPGSEFDALLFGLAALDVEKNDVPPPEAIDGVRVAVTAVGNYTWLRGMPTSINHAIFSVNGEYALGYGQYEVGVWESSTGKRLCCDSLLKPSEEILDSADITPDGRLLINIIRIVRTDDYRIEIRDIQENKSVYDYEWSGVVQAEVLDDHKHILLYSFTEKSFIIDAETTQKFEVNVNDQNTEKVLVSPEGAHLIALGTKGDLKVWDLSSGKLIKSLRPPAQKDAFFSPKLYLSAEKKRLILLADYEKSRTHFAYHIFIWSLGDYKLIKDVAPDSDKEFLRDKITESALSFDEKRLIILNKGPNNFVGVSIRDVETGDQLETQQSSIRNEDFWFDGVRITATDDEKHQLKAWDFATGKEVILLNNISGSLTAVDSSPNGQALISINNTTLCIRDVRKEPLNVENDSVAQLKSRACEQLHYQAEFVRVKAICGQ